MRKTPRAAMPPRRGTPARVAALVLPLAALLSVCSGPAPLEPTLGSIQARILDVHCARSGCHLTAQPDSRLVLRSGSSRDSLVDVPSLQIPERRLVVPFAPERSYLIQKLEGRGIVGETMPSGLGRLSPEEIDVIRQWIDRGAPDD